LGKETSVSLPKWQRVPFTHVLGPNQDIIHKAYLPHRQDELLIIKQLASKIGFDGLDLLQKLLEIDPKKRICLNQVLNHQFFGGCNFES
jgi:hypothetical protein